MIKTALITGATSGIGLALAKIFAKHEYNLVIVARKEEELKSTAIDLSSRYHIEVKHIPADLSQNDAPQKVFDFCHSQNISIDVLVNNAGFAVYGTFWAVETSKHLNIVQLNMLAPTHLTALFLPELINRKGKILNVASTAAFQPGPYMAVYYATKAYILSLSQALREELKPKGINVSCLCPGGTVTNYHKLADQKFLATKLHRYLPLTSAESVARAGFRGLMKNKPIIIPGFLNKFLAFWAQVLPNNLITMISKWTLQQ
ncbi:MAG: SDR family oxidoreductase [Candidatus Doudnabacteria bacterium]|nr:SDR family oxidoreductase [Candidatus Doudnabacteria bacterium]